MEKSASHTDLEGQFSNTHPGDYGIFGDPVEHSLSPVMQNAALAHWWKETGRATGKAPVYHPFHVKPEELSEAFSFAKKYQLAGFNITVPHKEKAADLVPLLDPFAEESKSINTVAINEAEVKGYNTDGFGFEVSLKHDLGFDPRGKNAFLLGAGGTGRVILDQLVLSGIKKVFLWNRSFDRAAAVAKRFKERTELDLVQTQNEMNFALSASDLVINATAVGLKKGDDFPAPGLMFSKNQCYFDVIYHQETPFLREARKVGAKAAGGLGMLIHQGARAFEIWTKAAAPIKIMKKALIEKMKAKDSDFICQFDI